MALFASAHWQTHTELQAIVFFALLVRPPPPPPPPLDLLHAQSSGRRWQRRSITASIGLSPGCLRRFQVQVDSGLDTPQLANSADLRVCDNDVGIKSEIYRNNQHEMLVSAGILGDRASGSQALGADDPNSIQPGVFFGKGFGDLPDGLALLRPFAVTGALVDELPFGTTTTALGMNSGERQVCKASLFLPSKRFTGGCPFNTAPIT